MNWDKKSIFATLVCFLFVMGYMYYLQNKYPDYYSGAQQMSEAPPQGEDIKPSDTKAVATGQTPENAPAPVVDAETVTALSDAELTFDGKDSVIQFDQARAGIKEIRLKDYLARKGDSEIVNLLDGEMVVQGSPVLTGRAAKTGWAAKREGQKITFTKTDGSWEVSQTYTVPTEGYGLEVDVSFKNISASEQELNATSLIKEELKIPEHSSNFLVPSSPADVGVLYGLGGSRKDKALAKICEKGAESFANLKAEKVDYIGFDKHYFLGLLWAKDQAADYVIERDNDAEAGHCQFSTLITQKFGMIAPGATQTMKLSGYFGPKKIDALEAFDPNLKSTVKLGWFSFFAHPLLLALKGVHQAVQNWGLAIIIVTLILKLAFYPLTRSAAISQKRMQKLQPQMNAIKERLKDDPARQQREIMAFMSQNKVNPFKGCLPILPQIPVFIAFYNVLSQAIELRHAPFYGWLVDLSSKDPYYITPILLGLGMFVQQKLTPNPGMDKNQEKIMLIMPIIFSAMMLGLPAGMVLYMMTNTVVSILQQRWLNTRLSVKEG